MHNFAGVAPAPSAPASSVCLESLPESDAFDSLIEFIEKRSSDEINRAQHVVEILSDIRREKIAKAQFIYKELQAWALRHNCTMDDDREVTRDLLKTVFTIVEKSAKPI